MVIWDVVGIGQICLPIRSRLWCGIHGCRRQSGYSQDGMCSPLGNTVKGGVFEAVAGRTIVLQGCLSRYSSVGGVLQVFLELMRTVSGASQEWGFMRVQQL